MHSVFNVSGNRNTGIGAGTLFLGNNNNDNTAIGFEALFTTGLSSSGINQGNANTAIGANALHDNTTGYWNVATGTNALKANTTGFGNTATGTSALATNSIGNNNTAMGLNTMIVGTGNDNTAMGSGALNSINTGNGNTSIGVASLFTNATGNNNTAIGKNADVTMGNLTNATAIGYSSKVGASNNLILGGMDSAAVDVAIGTTAAFAYGHGGTNRILELKNSAAAGGSVQSHLILSTTANAGSLGGLTWASTSLSGEQRTGFIGSIFETANQTRLSFYTRDNAGALNERFYIQGTGNAWLAGTLTQASDARLKKNIKPLSSILKNLTQLNGYTYNWINEQKDNEQQIGLLAQEVQKIYPQLVKENNKGELSVNYTGLVPVLLEGMKEQQKQIDELKKMVQQLIKNK